MSTNREVCHFEDFQKMNPGMAEKIRGGKVSAFDEHYAYRLVTSARQMKRFGGLVIRKPIEEYKLTGWAGPKGEKPSDYHEMKVEPMKLPPMCKCNHSVNWHKGPNSECDFPKCDCGGYKER